MGAVLLPPPPPPNLPPASPASLPSHRHGAPSRFLAYLVRHPVLCLLLLSPGIPEYLSSSTKISVLLINPFGFFLFWGLNAGLYGPGVLLIREAVLRWRKGWGAVLLLGAAYAILEEGIALSTLFNPLAGPVGSLGFYGHYLGVSWVWSAGLLMFHPVYSIALPILLLGLALPETKSKSLLSRRGVLLTFLVLAVDVMILVLVTVFGSHFWLGLPLLTGSLLVIAALVGAAYYLPADWLRARGAVPSAQLWPMVVTGLALFPGVLLIESILGALGLAAVFVIGLLAAWYVLVLWTVLRRLGPGANEPQLLALALGLLLSVAVFGFLASFPIPLVLLLDLLTGLFLVRLWGRIVRPTIAPLPDFALPPRGATL